MNTPALKLTAELRHLATRIQMEGWDRLRGIRLVHAAGQMLEIAEKEQWNMIAGRAETLVQMVSDFVREVPTEARLAPVLQSALLLADQIEKEVEAKKLDIRLLPANCAEYTFVLIGEGMDASLYVADALSSFGFKTVWVDHPDAVSKIFPAPKTILIATATWLAGQGEVLHPQAFGQEVPAWSAAFSVGVVGEGDFRSEIGARRAGAQLLIKAPLDVCKLLEDLAGLVWMPRTPYKVLIIDDDQAVMSAHAAHLQAVGCEVLAVDDPVSAIEFLGEFSPEVCVLDVEMPACRGTDLAALLRRDQSFSQLPIVYLSAYSDTEHQLDARMAGGEDYLVKPVDPRLLVAACVSRARPYRRMKNTVELQQAALGQLEIMRYAFDKHAIISVAGPDGSILSVNQQFCEISGYAENELLGRNHRMVKSGHHSPAVFDEMWRTISGGEVWEGEIQNRRKDGSHYWVKATIVPVLDPSGLPERYISIRTDITDQKRALVERERNARLLELLRKGFQHFVAHQDIKAVAEMLLDGMLLLSESAYGFLGEVFHDEEGAPYLLTHAVTDISWDEHSRMMFERGRAKGMEFRNLKTLFGAALRTGEIIIANDASNDPRAGGLPPGHPPLNTFLGLPIYHGDVMVGLAGIANRLDGYDADLIDFLSAFTTTFASMLEASRMWRIQRRVVSELDAEREKAITESMAKMELILGSSHDLRQLFDELLGNVQKLQLERFSPTDVELSLNRILESGKQVGRVIDELFMQSDSKDVQPTYSLRASPAQGRKLQVLVAEDNPANRAVLKMQLEVLGLAVDLVVDGPSALSKWKENSYHLILTDRNMPGMDGLALARSIRAAEQQDGRHVPIIGITAATGDEDVAVCLTAGMDDVLLKPISLEDIRDAIGRWIDLGASNSPAETSAVAAERRELSEPSKILDVAALQDIVGDVTPQQLRELIDLFTIAARADLPVCYQLLEDENGRELSLLMHRLKSSARMVGALRFAALAELIERKSLVFEFQSLRADIDNLHHVLSDTEGALLQLSVLPDIVGSQEQQVLLPLPNGVQQSRISVVDDDLLARRQMVMLLDGLGAKDVTALDSGLTVLAELNNDSRRPDLLIIDLAMPDLDGIEFIRNLADTGYAGCLMIASGMDERLILSAASLAQAKGLHLCGTLKKPVTRQKIHQLLLESFEKRSKRSNSSRPEFLITPADIEQGIAQGEFDIHFQPKVDAVTLKVKGVEALARWSCNGRMIPPDIFIGVAEATGLIGKLSETLILKALQGGRKIREAGFSLSLAVNVSANWLADITLPEFIGECLQISGFPRESLILEITETGALTDTAVSLDVMSRLRLKKFKLSIDDFGTGYSSMEQLQKIPFEELKLDRGFVHGATDHADKRTILSSSIEMAHKLKLSTVAEGVETQDDLDLVRGLGCDQVQGWLIARPMAVGDLVTWLQARR